MLISLTIVNVVVFIHVYICNCIKDGRTALIHAAIKGRTEIAELLVRSNADLNCEDKVRVNTTTRKTYIRRIRFVYVSVYDCTTY